MWPLSTGGLEVVSEPELKGSAPRAARNAPMGNRGRAVVRCAVITISTSDVVGEVGAEGPGRHPAVGPLVEVLPLGGPPS
jgi:hypothetical protein